MKTTRLLTFAILTLAAPLRAKEPAPDDVPALGAGRVIPLTAEQRAGERAAAEHRHDELIQAGIDAARISGQAYLEPLLLRLLKDGTGPEKAVYAGSAGTRYRFPERFELAQQAARFRPAYDRGIDCRATRCIQSGTEQACNNRSVCRVVCQAAGGAGGGAIGGVAGGAIGAVVGGEVCNQVCEVVPECRTVNVCYRYEYAGPGCF